MTHPAERLVFIDALMELGFEERRPWPGDADSGKWKGVRIFSDGDRGSVIVVRVADNFVNTIWSYGFVRGQWAKDSDPKRNHTFIFPGQWFETLAHIRTLIRLAEHKAATGETLPVPNPGSIF